MVHLTPTSVSGLLADRIALITGGLGGIGQAIAERFAAEGASVWIADIDVVSADRAWRDAAGYLQLDVTSEADWKTAASLFEREAGRLDILVNNAGVAVPGDIDSMSIEGWQRTMAVNAEGAFLAIRAMRPLLAKAGAHSRGWASIVNLSSILGMVGLGGTCAYAASKGAIRMLSRSLAVEFAAAGTPIRVNALHPGFVLTAMTRNGASEIADGGDMLAELAAKTPMGRLARTDEIAAAALFLASYESSFMTGAELVIDGGWTAQ